MKNIFKTSIACFLLLATLTGCTRKGEGENFVDNSLLQGDRYNLEVWTAQDIDFMKALGKEFLSSMNERGLTLDVVSFSSEQEMQQYLINDLAEGEGPDVVFTNGKWVNHHTEKLSPALESLGFTEDQYRQVFVRAAADTLIKDGQIWGVPMGVDSLAVFYNEDHLINNLKDRYEPAKNWDDFQKDVEFLNKPDNSFERFSVSGVATGRTDNTHYMFEVFENLYLQMGGTFFADSGRQAVFASQKGVTATGQRRNFASDALTFLTNFANSQHKSYAWSEFMADRTNPNLEYEPFVMGKVSMVFGFVRDWQHINSLLETPRGSQTGKMISKNNVRVSLLPQFYDTSKSADRAIIGKVYSLAVTKASERPDVAWEFLLFAANKDNLRSYFDQTRIPSPRLELISEQESDPISGPFVRQAKFAQTPVHPIDIQEITESFNEKIPLINDRKATPLEALSAMEREINDKISERYKKEKEIDQIRAKNKKES